MVKYMKKFFQCITSNWYKWFIAFSVASLRLWFNKLCGSSVSFKGTLWRLKHSQSLFQRTVNTVFIMLLLCLQACNHSLLHSILFIYCNIQRLYTSGMWLHVTSWTETKMKKTVHVSADVVLGAQVATGSVLLPCAPTSAFNKSCVISSFHFKNSHPRIFFL